MARSRGERHAAANLHHHHDRAKRTTLPDSQSNAGNPPTRAERLWLSRDAEIEELKRLLTPFPAVAMSANPASTRVNSAQNQEASLVEPLRPESDETLVLGDR